MTIWPADHPGRICAKCGCAVYAMWVDAIYPPPGTCQDKAPTASLCDAFRGRCISHLSACRIMDKAPHPDFLAMLDRAGVSLEQALVWRDDFQAKSEAEDAEFLASLKTTSN